VTTAAELCPFTLPAGTNPSGIASSGRAKWKLMLPNGLWVECRQAAPSAPWSLTIGSLGEPETGLSVGDVSDRLAEIAAPPAP